MEFHQEWPPTGRVTPACYLDLPGQLLALYAKLWEMWSEGSLLSHPPEMFSCPIRPIRRPWQEMRGESARHPKAANWFCAGDAWDQEPALP
jgi:hypothetical protein